MPNLCSTYFRRHINILVHGHSSCSEILYEIQYYVLKSSFSHQALCWLKRTSENKPNFLRSCFHSLTIKFDFCYWNIGLDTWFYILKVYNHWPENRSNFVKFCSPNLISWHLQTLFCSKTGKGINILSENILYFFPFFSCSTLQFYNLW